jgi:hypothetical protein
MRSNRGEPPLRWILLATMWTRLSGGPTIVDAGQTVCLENRQHVAACEQIFSNDRSAGAGHPPKAFENQRLIRLARIVLRSMAAQHRSGDRFRLACHAL